jgi:O-succinylhomoserine sulfhydrylase
MATACAALLSHQGRRTAVACGPCLAPAIDRLDPVAAMAWRESSMVRPRGARGTAKPASLESCSNPPTDAEIADSAVADLPTRRALVVVENARQPLHQKPPELGATWWLFPHRYRRAGRVLAGGARPTNGSRRCATVHRNTGPSISPFNAWLLLKGLETLALRVDAGSRSAAVLADFLGCPARNRPRLVSHPRRPPQRDLWRR